MITEDIIKNYIISDMIKSKKYSNIGIKDNLIETGIIDSLGIQKMINFLEKKFSIHISDNDLIPDNFETIADLAKLVDNLK